MKPKFRTNSTKLIIWLIIFKLTFLFNNVQSNHHPPTGLNNLDRSLLTRTIKLEPLNSLNILSSSKSSKLSFKSIPITSKSKSLSSKNLLPKRIKRENQLLINNELGLTNGLNSHDSNTFQPNVWTQELSNAQLADGERHLSSDIELPEYSEEDDDLDDEQTNGDPEKDADYEEEELEGEKQRKKNGNKKQSKNRSSKKKDKNSNTDSLNTGMNTDNQIQSVTQTNTTANDTTSIRKSTKDYTTNYIELISGPGNLTKKAGEKVVLRCSFEAKPKPKIKFLKNEGPLDKSIRNKYQIKEKRLSNNKFSIRLIISQLDTHDTGFYQCKASNSQGVKAEGVGILKVQSSDQDDRNGLDIMSGSSGDAINLDNTIIPAGDSTFHMTQDAGTEIDRLPFFQDYSRFSDSNGILDSDQTQQLHNTHSLDTLSNSPHAQCVPYKGTVCSQYLRNHTVIVHRQSQYQLEELLNRAFRIIANAAGISPQCHRFTMPLLCFQSFHVCEQIDFNQFTDQYSSNSLASNLASANNLLNRMQQMQADHPLAYSSHYTATKQQPYSLKQLCRDECEILEHDICSMEFTLAKINPVAGLKSLLPNCEKLPTVGSSQHENCLRIGVTQDFYTPLTNHKCYLDKGETYRGNVNTTISGKTCEIWSTISRPNSNHPELSGSHNFCRNPKGIMNGPWCNVRSNENQQYYKELCDVPKCDDHFWIYYVLTPLLAILTLSVLIGSICFVHNCNRKRKPSMEGICLSANELFAQQHQLHQQHLLQSNVNSLTNNSLGNTATPLRMTLPYAYGCQTNISQSMNQQQNGTSSSKQSNYSLLSNVLNSVTNPGRALGNAIGQSMKNTNNANGKKLDLNAKNNLELKALLSNNESPTNATSHYALSSMLPINNGMNITENPLNLISNNPIYYPLNCIRILTRIYPRLETSSPNSHNSNSDDTPSTHLKSSLNYQFYAGQLSISNQKNLTATQPVTIRALKLTTDAQNVSSFAEQAAQLCALNHENVIKMLGCSIGGNNHSTIPQHFLIFEQFSPVNLIHFFQQQPLPSQLATNGASSFNPPNSSYLVEYLDLLQIAYQIANGMHYLSDQHGYVHGDLACRNCYITNSTPSSGSHSRYHLKIGGLHLQNLKNVQSSRWLMNNEDLNGTKTFKSQEIKEEIVEEQLDDQDYYTLNVQRKAFPVRWLPPEVLLTHEYSSASDTWSFGVCCWEIAGFARQIPFQSYNNSQVVDLIITGRLLECPVYSDASFYALMLDCWNEIPSQRPSFADLAQKLTQQINNLKKNSSRNEWLNSSIRNNRVCSPMPSQNRLAVKNGNNKQFQQVNYGEDKVNGWLLNSKSEFNNSTNYLPNNTNNLINKNGQTASQTNTMNSSSTNTYASSYCNQTNTPNNYNGINSTLNQQQPAEYDQPFAQLNDLEANHKLLKQPALSTFQQQPSNKQSHNGLTVGLKHLELKNNLINHNNYNNYKNISLDKPKNDDYYENHYSKLSYENEETESMVSSNFGLI